MVLGKLSEQLQLVSFILSVLGAHPVLCLSPTEGPEKHLQQAQNTWSGKQQRIQQPNGTKYF